MSRSMRVFGWAVLLLLWSVLGLCEAGQLQVTTPEGYTQKTVAEWDGLNLFQILGVGRAATIGDVRSAYRRLALVYHPDKSSLPDAAERFRIINDAKEILSDPRARARYEIWLETGNIPTGYDSEYYKRAGFYYAAYNAPSHEGWKVILSLIAIFSAMQYLYWWYNYNAMMDRIRLDENLQKRMAKFNVQIEAPRFASVLCVRLFVFLPLRTIQFFLLPVGYLLQLFGLWHHVERAAYLVTLWFLASWSRLRQFSAALLFPTRKQPDQGMDPEPTLQSNDNENMAPTHQSSKGGRKHGRHGHRRRG